MRLRILAVGLFAMTLSGQRLSYPETKRVEQVDTLHGEAVADPYRWLEDDNAAEVKDWVARQNRLTFGWLKDTNREALRARISELWRVVKYPRGYHGGMMAASLQQRGARVFYLRHDEQSNQPRLYWKASADAPAKVLLDPNTLAADGTSALASWTPSPDGKLLAYGVSVAGSDWQVVRVRNVDTGEDLADKLEWVKFTSHAWTPDSRSFYYSRFPQPVAGALLTAQNVNQKLYRHEVGKPQAADALVYERPDQPRWRFGCQVSEDGRHTVLTVGEGTRRENQIFLLEGGKTRALTGPFEASYDYIGSAGEELYFLTTKDAPRQRVVALDGKTGAAREVVAQAAETLDQAVLDKQRLYLNYLKDATNQLRVVELKGGAARPVTLPGLGTVALAPDSPHFTFGSFTSPDLLYRFDPATGASRPVETPKLPLDAAAFETRQVFYASKDGTRVPMFLVHRKGLQPKGDAPTLLYGYGGFNISVTPAYRATFVAWVDRGGLLAVPNLRGGGEYGEEWHQAGTKLRKQNVFDDFIAAAEYLVKSGYTTPKRLAIHGGSNGGLLVGACLNQRPDLFGAAIPAVGVMDMLRFHKFTVGAGWISDYGSPDNPEEYKALKAYSPLHNIKAGTQYPATLVLTSDHDDRVVPAHSFKYAAALQRAQEGPAPVLIRVETAAGHGAGKPIAKQIEEVADTVAFLERALGK